MKSAHRHTLTYVLTGAALLLLLAVVLLLKGARSGDPRLNGHPETTLEQDLLAIDPNDPETLTTVFELHFAKLRAATAQVTISEFKLDGFAIAPRRTLDSVVARQCLPRARHLKAKSQTLPAGPLAEAVPGHILHGDPRTICRDLVAEALARARPALVGIESGRLFALLDRVDRLAGTFHTIEENRLEGPNARHNFDAYTAARGDALGDPVLDRALFAVQDDHTRLGLDYTAFVATAARTLPATERIAHYQAMVTAFETKHNLRLADHAHEKRDHLGRLLGLLNDDQPDSDTARFALIKKHAGEKAALRDREERAATRDERASLADFERERSRLIAGITHAADSEAYRKRLNEIESELTEKFFSH